MKIKNSEIINHLNSLPQLADVDLPVQVTYAIKKNHRKLVSEYKDYEDPFNELRIKYPIAEDLEKSDELKDLLNIEVDIEFFKIPESIFETGDFNITLKQFEILEFMVETE
jgi:hypothetical protein